MKKALLASVILLTGMNIAKAEYISYATPQYSSVQHGLKYYAGIRGGIEWAEASSDMTGTKNKYKDYFPIGGAFFGVKTSEDIRFELEYSYNSELEDVVKGVKGNFSSHALQVNAYYNFGGALFPMNFDRLQPFVGVGVGGAYVEGKENTFDKDKMSLIFNGQIGLSYALTERVDFETSVRYSRIVYKDGIDNVAVMAGFRFDF